MKNFTLLAFVALLLSACAKEDFVPIISDSPDGTTQLYVKVVYSECDYDNQECDADKLLPLENSEVYLYENEDANIEGKSALMYDFVDDAGIVKFKDLQNTEYFLEVISRTKGTKTQKVTVETGKIKRIQIKY